MSTKKRKSIENLALAIASTKFDIASSKEHIEKQEKELKDLESKFKAAKHLNSISKGTAIGGMAVLSEKKPSGFSYFHAYKLYRATRRFDLYPFIYTFRMKIYVDNVADIHVTVEDKYLKERAFTNIRMENLDKGLSPEGIFKAAVKEYFTNFKQPQTTQEQIYDVFKELDVFICRDNVPDEPFVPTQRIEIGKMKYIFRTRQTMPKPGETQYGIEGEMEIINMETKYSVKTTLTVESMNKFIEQYLLGVTSADIDEVDLTRINGFLLEYNLLLVPINCERTIYKVIHR